MYYTVTTEPAFETLSNAGSVVIVYGVATVSRIDKFTGLFCRISSLL